MTERYVFSTVLASILFLISPAQEKFVTAQFSFSELASPKLTSARFVVDTKQTQLHWKGSSLFNFNEHSGKVNISKGDLTVEKNVVTSGSIEVDMSTIVDTDNATMLIDHLKSPDFFDTKKYPTATFKITKVEPISDGRPGQENFSVKGDLTIKGITNPIDFPAKIEVNEKEVRAQGRFIIDRTKWNVKFGSGRFFDNLGDDTISDAIQFNINLYATKQ